jgi:hypothetical protein
MTKKNNKSTNTPAALPHLLPLEYCRIDRAARLLGCEVEDIIHWGVIGAIDLGYKLTNMRGGLIVDDEQFTNSPDVKEWFSSGDFFAHKQLSMYASFAVDMENSLAVKGAADSSAFSFSGEASGIWFISGTEIEFVFENGGFDISQELSMVMAAHSHDYGLCPMFAAMLEGDEIYRLSASNLVITRHCLLKLQRSIATGEVLPNILNSAELAQRARKQEATIKAGPPHHSAERHATNREAVLKAALYCKEYFPEQCKTYRDWAYTIDQKAPLFWPKTGIPPLSRARIERLLGEAYKLPADR